MNLDFSDRASRLPLRVGFVGIGTMGQPMAANLAGAVESLLVHDLDARKGQSLVALGARWVDEVSTMAQSCDLVCISLPNPADVHAVVTGANGLLAHLRRGSLIIDLSTNSPSTVRELYNAARVHESSFLDAPVSGGSLRAKRGTLTVMVGGDQADFERARPLLEVIGEQVLRVGPSGSGSVAKLINNTLFLTNVISTIEALMLGKRAGVDLQVLWELVCKGSGSSFAWEYGAQSILKDRLSPTFRLDLAAKDAALAVVSAYDLECPFDLGNFVSGYLNEIVEGGLGDSDVFGAITKLEKLVGVTVRGAWKTEPDP